MKVGEMCLKKRLDGFARVRYHEAPRRISSFWEKIKMMSKWNETYLTYSVFDDESE
jgi:hypothetical protein